MVEERGMNAVELHQYIQNPDLLTSETLPGIKQALSSYPYFQALQMLYLLNLWKIDSPDFRTELERLATGITNRKVLYRLLKNSPDLSGGNNAVPDSVADSFALIDAFLAGTESSESEKKESQALLLEPSVSADYFQWKEVAQSDPVSQPESEQKEVKLKHQDLIDSFLENDMAHKPMWKDNEQVEDSVQEEDEEEDVSLKQLDDSYFTETLARIYVKQKRYDKALQIIKNLSLKYPEKNIYFADQIRFLEKLIINTKK